jgi:TatD DNase family protein
MRLVDSHCHLDGARFDADRAEAIARARAAGVGTLVAIGTGEGPPDLEAGLRLAAQYECVYATVGVHPHDAAKCGAGTLEEVERLSRRPKVVAVGEIGLDYHYDFSPRDAQWRVFEEQLAIAARAGLPVVIHTREAWDDTIAILRAQRPPAGGILHCFPGGVKEAEEALGLGFHLGYTGIVTFPRATEVQAAAAMTPLDRLLVETDAPYLAPVPYRGQRCEPAHAVETARKLAELKACDPEELAEVTTANWERLCLQGRASCG